MTELRTQPDPATGADWANAFLHPQSWQWRYGVACCIVLVAFLLRLFIFGGLNNRLPFGCTAKNSGTPISAATTGGESAPVLSLSVERYMPCCSPRVGSFMPIQTVVSANMVLLIQLSVNTNEIVSSSILILSFPLAAPVSCTLFDSRI